MLNPSKLNEMRKIAQNPSQSEPVDALATIIVALEFKQLDAVEDLHDAHDIDGIEVNATREERKESLLALADAVADGSLRRHWFKTVVAEHIENWEDALAYAGLDGDEWSTQIAEWADLYQSKTDEFADDSDREIARQHVMRVFGVSLDAFEREVVGYSRQEVLQTALAGNFEHGIKGIRAAEAVAREGEDDSDTGDGGSGE